MLPNDMTNKLGMLAISVGAILALAIGVSLMTAQDAEAQARNTKWLRGSWVETSIPHNAEGHSAHQVVDLFSPQDGFVYNGKVTFTSSKGIDIIAYHDITDQSAEVGSLKVWSVEGKIYGTTTLMTNVTSGTVDFVGTGLVTHSASSDPYTVVFSADGIARRANPQ